MIQEIPPPPVRLDRLPLVISEINPRHLVRLAWSDPATHDKFRREIRFRFDAPDGSFGVLYAAFDLETAFAETVLRDKPSLAGAAPGIPLDYSEIDSRWVVALKSGRENRPLQLIKLFDEGLAAARTDNRIATVDDYPSTQRWAKALHDHPIAADGIVYMSRFMGARQSVALFDRCQEAIAVQSALPLMQHREFGNLVDLFNLAIDPPVTGGAGT